MTRRRYNYKRSYARQEWEHTIDEIKEILSKLGYKNVEHFVLTGVAQKLTVPEMGRWLVAEAGVRANRKRLWSIVLGPLRKIGRNKYRPARLVAIAKLEQLAQAAGFNTWDEVEELNKLKCWKINELCKKLKIGQDDLIQLLIQSGHRIGFEKK